MVKKPAGIKPAHMDSRGSTWHRWDPHIHGPGTLLSDQYTGPDPFNDFLKEIETSEPRIRALGITDYYSVEIYERVLQAKENGRLPDVELIFPNIELRFTVETASGAALNAHLLVSPEDPGHVAELRRFLLGLTFPFGGEDYRCDLTDLRRLGKAFNPVISDERKALEEGANQFKVNYEQLRDLFNKSEWAQKHILVAVSASSNDGTSGLQRENNSLTAVREELERRANIIFASQEKQREFWLGQGAVEIEELTRKWGGCKPCLHGSDAHRLAKVGKPDKDRFCWIKGDITFETLRQACIEPEGRAKVSELVPIIGSASQIITKFEATDAAWLETASLPINPGLVAVIGARGSGKTALADLIAVGAFSLSAHLNSRSFVHRATPLLTNEAVTLTWGIGEPTKNELKHVGIEDFIDSPRVQYLSQQFVEELCSAEGPTDRLMAEMERVIFHAHEIEDRLGTTRFVDLRDLKTASARAARSSQENEMAEASQELIAMREKVDALPALKKQVDKKITQISNDKKTRASLIGKGQEVRALRHAEVSTALDLVRNKMEKALRNHQALLRLQDDTTRIKSNSLASFSQKMRSNHGDVDLTDEQWAAFNLRFDGDVDGILKAEIDKTNFEAQRLRGPIIAEDNEAELLASDGALSGCTYHELAHELNKIQGLIGTDKENARKYGQITQKIGTEEAALAKLQRDIEAAEKAPERVKVLIQRRRVVYQEIFDALLLEEAELVSLYKPLAATLKEHGGIVGKLAFHVRRDADVTSWADRGEKLLDLRKTGDFKGKGALLDAIKEHLQNAWEIGSAEDVAQAMASFRDKYESAFLSHAPIEKSDKQRYRAWANSVSEWLYSTDHISIGYGIQYDGVDINQLSPGTRGVVLLLLYLAIDSDDDRPLLIDQPEENLDPQSIYEELVPLFRTAKMRRQIIIVTHNANLVVNTDADQVIVATCGPHRPGNLPVIKYESGGLENPLIREKVCAILEGGERAFKERAKRLRVVL